MFGEWCCKIFFPAGVSFRVCVRRWLALSMCVRGMVLLRKSKAKSNVKSNEKSNVKSNVKSKVKPDVKANVKSNMKSAVSLSGVPSVSRRYPTNDRKE